MFKRLVVSLLLITLTVQAQIYRTIQPNGEVMFSDTPQNSASQKIDVQDGQNFPVLDVPAVPPSKPQAVAPRYVSFTLEAPAEVMREGEPEQKWITVTLHVEPALKPGHWIELSLNDAPFKLLRDSGRTEFVVKTNLLQIYRGEHIWQARLFASTDSKPLIETERQTMVVIQPMLPLDSPLRAPTL